MRVRMQGRSTERTGPKEGGREEGEERYLTSFLDPDGSLVVDGVLLVVNSGIVPDQTEILLKVIQGAVGILQHLPSHRVEVHRFLDDIKVIWYLQRVKTQVQSQEAKGHIQYNDRSCAHPAMPNLEFCEKGCQV